MQQSEARMEVSNMGQDFAVNLAVDEERAMASAPARSETVVEVAHDARNMVAALGLYCDLLQEPGVLATPFVHYGLELRQVAVASRRLLDKLAAMGRPAPVAIESFWRGESRTAELWPARLPGENHEAAASESWGWELPPASVTNFASELMATRNLLSALAGPAIVLTVEVESGARPARISTEDLTRVLVNLVKNGVEAMADGGRIHITLRERSAEDGDWLVLAIEDNGPGIPDVALERIFDSGFTGHSRADGRPAIHRGLGLAITRAIVEAAGGRIYAENRLAGGTRMVMELPAGR
jgi:signal transduction histidine kinase